MDKSEIDDAIEKLKCSHLLLELQQDLQIEIKKSSVYSGDVRIHAKKFIKDSGYAVKLQNLIFKVFTNHVWMFKKMEKENVEPLVYIKKAQRSWARCIVKSINSMCTELALPLAKKRSTVDQNILADKFNSMMLGAEYNDEMYSKLRPVYSAADFFEVVISVKNTNTSQTNKSLFESWHMIQAQLYSPDFEELTKQFSSLTGTQSQLGIDDAFDTSFESDWLIVGQKVVAKQHMGAATQYLKQGCLPGLRKSLWKILFDIHLNDADIAYYEQLKSFVFEYDMLVDYLIMKDVRLTAVNDEAFFVFEDVLYQVLLVFSRDTTVLDHFSYSSAVPPKSYIEGKLGVEDYSVDYPPNGIFPFHGFSMMAAPLCYIYDESVELYYVFRYLYTRYFFLLHTLSSHKQGILSLCTLFEQLLQTKDALLYKHLLDIKAHPLRLVFNWFLFAYSGYLATDETLQLWDRILGFNSLLILPILGVAIVSYRRDNLLSVNTLAACEAVLADISTIKVIPVLVNFLSGKSF